ncbi:hemolysins and related proteins containing CBS domains [Porphyromonas crevioricanis JCM 15906]|uniref:Hemolysins and related proteins containing CBS domains n=1 Tax=Porphyromonas crevioricanis JCM 15906 TaxID=1305617 RepID=T1DR98_9PORP|nr:hemolysins and related proteins containing CBS domains [Porphyromonas crevioricanis JCM 15906]
MDSFSSLGEIFSQVQVSPISVPVAIALVLVVLLLIASGYMSSSEVAFFSIKPADLAEVKAEKTDADRVLKQLLSNPEELLACILIGNNIVNVAVVMLSTYAVNNIFDFSRSPMAGFILQTIALTLVLLLFGEIIPKVYAQRSPLDFSRFSAPKMRIVRKILNPISWLLVRSTAKLVDARKGRPQHDLSVDDLSKAVQLTTGSAAVEEKAMISEIIKFYSKTASEVMVPRIDMVDIDISWDFEKMLEFAVSSGYSRIPVYEESEDNIKGIIYLKDLIPHRQKDASFAWQNLMRPAYFVPENKRIDDLLEELRANKVHMSIVVDEFGGTSGIITMEDILEEIVGEITDEYDEEELPYTRYPDGSCLFEAKTSLSDVRRYLQLDEDAFGELGEEVDTLGGLVLEIKQDLPLPGDEVTYNGWHFVVVSMDKRRILEVKLHRKSQQSLESAV